MRCPRCGAKEAEAKICFSLSCPNPGVFDSKTPTSPAEEIVHYTQTMLDAERRTRSRKISQVEELRNVMENLGDGADGGGRRMNAGKLRMDLLPPEWDHALADVITQGSKKYDERNWEEGMKWSTMVGCMKRHLNKFLAGERYDGEEFNLEAGTTGCHHLAMLAWNALALMSYDLRGIGTNDLPTDVQLELFDRTNAATSDLSNDVHE